MKPSEVLIAAKALIDAPEKWVKEVDKTMIGGFMCYCPLGALEKINGPAIDEIPRSTEFLVMVVGVHVAQWNDAPNRTHAEVMAAFDRAIALAQEASE